jgi:transposase
MARPEKKLTDEQRRRVKTLSGYGLSQEQIASLEGIHVQTLRKHCKEEMEKGKAEAYATAVNSLFANIKKGKEASLIFYLKTQHRWTERSTLEVEGALELPTPIFTTTPPKKK